MAEVVQPDVLEAEPGPQSAEPVGDDVGSPRPALGRTEQQSVVGQATYKKAGPADDITSGAC